MKKNIAIAIAIILALGAAANVIINHPINAGTLSVTSSISITAAYPPPENELPGLVEAYPAPIQVTPTEFILPTPPPEPTTMIILH